MAKRSRSACILRYFGAGFAFEFPLLMPKIEEIGFFCKLYLPRKNIFAIILPVVTAQVMMQKPFWGGGAIG